MLFKTLKTHLLIGPLGGQLTWCSGSIQMGKKEGKNFKIERWGEKKSNNEKELTDMLLIYVTFTIIYVSLTVIVCGYFFYYRHCSVPQKKMTTFIQ